LKLLPAFAGALLALGEKANERAAGNSGTVADVHDGGVVRQPWAPLPSGCSARFPPCASMDLPPRWLSRAARH
jgi:hypothetical protein